MKILLQTSNTRKEEGETKEEKPVYNSVTKYLPEMLSSISS